jgi:hypothetical protein
MAEVNSDLVANITFNVIWYLVSICIIIISMLMVFGPKISQKEMDYLVCKACQKAQLRARGERSYKEYKEYNEDNEEEYENTSYKEHFTIQDNETTTFSDRDALFRNYSFFQRAELTATQDTVGNPNDLQSGLATRLVEPGENSLGTTPTLYMEIYAGLYLLNANPFGENLTTGNKPVPQKYNVYLVNTKTKGVKLFGELKNDSSQVYKLKYQTSDPEIIKDLMSYNKLAITYSIKKTSPASATMEVTEIPLLEGNFTV